MTSETLAIQKKNLCLLGRFFQPRGKKESGQIMYEQETGVQLSDWQREISFGQINIIGSFEKLMLQEIGILL